MIISIDRNNSVKTVAIWILFFNLLKYLLVVCELVCFWISVGIVSYTGKDISFTGLHYY